MVWISGQALAMLPDLPVVISTQKRLQHKPVILQRPSLNRIATGFRAAYQLLTFSEPTFEPIDGKRRKIDCVQQVALRITNAAAAG